jgi:hypothetical protein
VKLGSGSSSEDAKLKLAYRGISYANGGGCTIAWPYGDRSEGRSNEDLWVTVRSDSTSIDTTWEKMTSGVFYVRNDSTGESDYDDDDSHDFRLRIVSEEPSLILRIDTGSMRENP